MSDHVLIFANPIAGRGRGERLASRIAEHLTREGYRASTFLDRVESIHDDALAAARDANCIIVIGGDGTLRAVARRLLQLHGDAPPLLVVPLGTANLMGQHLGLKWETRTIERQIIDAIRAGHTVALDTATANDELFLLIAGVGIDGRIVHELTRVRRGPLAGKANYLLPAAVAISKYRYPRLTVSVDGKTIFEDKPAMAFVGNVREYGTGFPLLPLARSDDGLLDVCVTPCANPIEAARLLLHSVAGDLLQVDGVVYAKGTRVRVESPDPVEIQLDGDAAGHTPLDVALLPRKLRFIVPRSP